MDGKAETMENGISGSGEAAQAQDTGLEAFEQKAQGGGAAVQPDLAHGQQEMAQAQAEQGKAGADAGTSPAGAEKGKAPQDGASFDARAWDAYVDSLEADLGVDKEALRSFGKIAGELSMSADAAEKIFQWGMENSLAIRKAQVARGREELQKEWGADYKARIDQATSVVAMLDRELGDGRFKKAIEESGVCANPDFARGLYHIASLLAEDSLGTVGQGAAQEKEESALEGLKAFFK